MILATTAGIAGIDGVAYAFTPELAFWIVVIPSVSIEFASILLVLTGHCATEARIAADLFAAPAH
jgi:hypothetical protein